MLEQVRIEQSLFGYHDGHNLIAASTELAPRVRQFLANVTDGSGPGASEGFEAACTGLPVPETKYYAIFRTWSAPEMPRPGCVWSHVVLIDLSDLARISDLSILGSLCLRPTMPLELSNYEVPLHAPYMRHDAVRLYEPNDLDRAAFLLAAIYGTPDSGIAVFDDKSGSWEKIVFAIWSQQWPKLRRSFAFSTGSLGDRRVGGVGFDLQIAPQGSQRLWRRNNLPTVVLEYVSDRPLPQRPAWLQVSLEDLTVGSEGALRKFLFAYGSEIEAPRKAFSKLVENYMQPKLNEDDDPGRSLSNLALAFPKPNEALGLKRDKLTAFTDRKALTNFDSFWAATYFLLQAREADSFSKVPLDFYSQAATLWKRKRADVLALLNHLPESKRASDFIDALAKTITSDDVPKLWVEQPTILPRILIKQPTLATQNNAWNLPLSGQQYLWETLRAITRDQKIWGLTCAAMLGAQCSLFERETVELAGKHFFDALNRWLMSENFRLPSPGWREALIAPLEKGIKEGPLPPALLALAAWALPPEQANSLRGDREDVQALARQVSNDVPEPLRLHSLFWLTTLGFKTPGDDGLALLVRAFFPVYRSVALSDYPGEAWERLAPVLPEVRFGLGWDRCRRLRRALRQWIHDRPHLVNALSGAAPTLEYKNMVHELSAR